MESTVEKGIPEKDTSKLEFSFMEFNRDSNGKLSLPVKMLIPAWD